MNTGFSSKYGYIKGTFSPSEAGRVFARWFGEIGNSSREPGLKKEMVRGSVYFLSTLFGCPFLAKNLNNSLRLRRIRAIFPEGVFVWVKRDPLFVCQSILEMRRTVTGSDHHWVSVTPLGYEKLSNRSPLEQVAWQVATIEKNIEHDLSKGQMEKVIPVDYESLCEEPQKVLRDICFFYERVAGIPLEETGTRIHSLKPSNRQRLSGQEWKLLKSYVEQYSGKKSRISSVNDKQQ
ncbi:MAG: hypothetical protein DRH15_11115 [Deltaproteobacteria bacterium]|nr:MAG: hypothetical protein DRH15_11115 [Deltaproteobacteria bacterium]